MNDGYFLRHTPEEIAWHTRLLAEREPDDASPIVAVREATERGGNSVLTYMPHRQHNFARTTALLDQMGLTSSMRASPRSRAASASTPTWCSRTRARR